MKCHAHPRRRVPRIARVCWCVLLVGACQADPWYAGRPSGEWIAQLQTGDTEGREAAAAALGNVLAINPRLARPITALRL